MPEDLLSNRMWGKERSQVGLQTMRMDGPVHPTRKIRRREKLGAELHTEAPWGQEQETI